MFEEFSQEERASYLKFVWGRTRLPIEPGQTRHKIKLVPGWAANALPQSHTCFFTLDLPPYQTDEMCRSRIIYAAEHCG